MICTHTIFWEALGQNKLMTQTHCPLQSSDLSSTPSLKRLSLLEICYEPDFGTEHKTLQEIDIFPWRPHYLTVIITTFYPFGHTNFIWPSCFKGIYFSGLPWWLSDRESTCQCRRHGYHPWSRKIPHAVEQWSPCPTTIEPVLQSPGAATELMCYSYWSPRTLEPMLCKKRSHHTEKPGNHNWRAAPAPSNYKKVHTTMKTYMVHTPTTANE